MKNAGKMESALGQVSFQPSWTTFLNQILHGFRKPKPLEPAKEKGYQVRSKGSSETPGAHKARADLQRNNSQSLLG